MENQTNLPSLKADTAISRHVQVSTKILTLPNLNTAQRLWLIEVLSYQVMGGELPYLSMSQFATRNKMSPDTISKHITSMVDRNIIWKYGQKADGLACQYQINPDFLKDMGYVPDNQKRKVNVVFEVSDDEEYIKRELAMYDNEAVESPF